MSGNLSDDELWTLLCAPAARYSEHRSGDQASYLAGGELVTGEVLYVADGEGGQLYIIENQASGFPDVVRAGELQER